METEVQNFKLYQEINGIRFASFYSPEHINACLKHNSKTDIDLIIATCPKSGTTWLSHIVYLILNNGNPGGSGLAYKHYEYKIVTDFDSNSEKNRVMLTHLPITALPHNNSKTKFIFVLRNPKDVVVSYYNFAKSLLKSTVRYKGDFQQLFKHWINGEVVSGDYFGLILEWLTYRNNPNFQFVFYENLIRNKREEILRIAGFIDEKYRQKLMANDYNNTYMENVLKHSSIEHMKKQITEVPSLVRKGIIGDWRSYLSKEESDIIDNKMIEKLGDTDLIDIWKNDMLWQNK